MNETANGASRSLGAEETFRIGQTVKDRLIDYWRDVDRNGARCALDFYTEDCVYLMCGNRMEGHSAIKRYYDHRDSRGPRLVRHVVSNLRAQVRGLDEAFVEGVLCVYAADGVPVLPSAPPIMVADNECEFVRDASGI